MAGSIWHKLGKPKVLGVVLVVCVLGVLLATPALAQGTSATPNPDVEGTESWIARIVSGLASAYISLVGRLLTVLISILVFVSGYSDFVNSAAVVNGWVIVRDIANMFFIIVLLIVAFGTILGQEQYHYKKLLPKLLIMAVLVNFSRTIVGVLIDAAQVIMLTFVNGYQAAAGGNFASIFGILDLLEFDREACLKQTGTAAITDREIMLAHLLAAVLITISIITVIVILSVLVLRIIMLWLLTVLSPMAFLAGTFPQGQKYYSKWWEEFQNQAIVGPVLAFFLWLSLVTVGAGNAASQISSSVDASSLSSSDFPGVSCTSVGSAASITSFIIGTMMLLAGVQMAQEMGGAISGAVSQAKAAAKRGLKMGLRLGYKAAKPAVGYGAERFSAATKIEIRPSKWKEAYKNMRETSKDKRERKISATAMQRLSSENRLTRFLAVLGAPTDFLEKPGAFLRAAARGGPSEARERLLEAMRTRQQMQDHQLIGKGPSAYLELQEQSAQQFSGMRKGTEGTLTKYRQQQWKEQGKDKEKEIENLERQRRGEQTNLNSAVGRLSAPDKARVKDITTAWEQTRDATDKDMLKLDGENTRLENEEAAMAMELQIDLKPMEERKSSMEERQRELGAIAPDARTGTQQVELQQLDQLLPQIEQEITARNNQHQQKYGTRLQEIGTRKTALDIGIQANVGIRQGARASMDMELRAINPDIARANSRVRDQEENILTAQREKTKIEINAKLGSASVGTDDEKRLLALIQKYRGRQVEAEKVRGLDAEELTGRWLEDRNKTIEMRLRLKTASAGGAGALSRAEFDDMRRLLSEKFTPAQMQEFDAAGDAKKREIIRSLLSPAVQTAT